MVSGQMVGHPRKRGSISDMSKNYFILQSIQTDTRIYLTTYRICFGGSLHEGKVAGAWI
jgi:hypothetical protein